MKLKKSIIILLLSLIIISLTTNQIQLDLNSDSQFFYSNHESNIVIDDTTESESLNEISEIKSTDVIYTYVLILLILIFYFTTKKYNNQKI